MMFHSGLRVLTTAAYSWAVFAGMASAMGAPSISVKPELTYNISTLTITGSAICYGGGQAEVTVVDGSLEQMFRGGIGGPIAVQLDGPVLVDCDGALHAWQGHLVAPGRALPNDAGGTVTVTLAKEATVIATTGEQPVRIMA